MVIEGIDIVCSSGFYYYVFMSPDNHYKYNTGSPSPKWEHCTYHVPYDAVRMRVAEGLLLKRL